MWTFLNIDQLPRGETPTTWLDRVLPRPRGTYLQHCTRARQAIRNNALDESLTVFASDDRGPVGLVHRDLGIRGRDDGEEGLPCLRRIPLRVGP